MSAKASGEIKTIRVQQKQKNGDIYVIERKIRYDLEKKYNVVQSSKVVGKIVKGSSKIVPTRPKKKHKDDQVKMEKESSNKLTATRLKTGMMDIIDYIGKVSGIDDAIYESSEDLGTAQKIISLARYLLATNGQSLPGITAWQFTHSLPYEDGFSEEIYHNLFESLGRNETLQQNFFKLRCEPLKQNAVLAYDSTTISTYSGNLPEARRGFNKAKDGLETIKLLTLYSVETRQPVAFSKQPGNIPDVITIENALKQFEVLGIGRAQIVTDNGYYSESNLSHMLLAHYDFITLVKTSIKWVKAELDAHLNDFQGTSRACPFDPITHGITITLKRDFKKTRKYASNTSGAKKGDEETFSRRVYLNLYFNAVRKNDEDASLDRDLIELKTFLETKGNEVEDLNESTQNKVASFLNITKRGDKTTITFNDAAIIEQKKYHGFFALVSNSEKDAFECLKKYRKRETIEFFFESGKQRADGTRPRVWHTDALRGRMFVQFITLCYYEYFLDMIRNMKEKLGVKTGDPQHDLKQNLDKENELKSWLDKTPLYLVLQWFDAIEEVKVSNKLRTKRWSTEKTSRDKMFLAKLGMNLS